MPDTPNTEARTRGSSPLVLLLLALPFAAAAWWLIEEGVRVSDAVAWECWGGECSTDDPRALLPVAGIACNVVVLVLLTKSVRVTGFGLSLALGPYAAVSGAEQAVADGVPAAEVAGGQQFWFAVAVVGAAVAVLGLLLDLKVTGYGARLLGAQRVRATLTDFKAGEGDYGRTSAETLAKSGFGMADLTFTHHGSRHRIRVPARSHWHLDPVFAVFRDTSPEKARLARPWFRRAKAPGKILTSTNATTTHLAAHGHPVSIATELERLAALRADGSLTQEEFEAAKRRLLDEQ
ncbi:SHOCT domain-containing protein [Glycomyces terrestris]|uniref:SHOCT domain-containing protein n=1 Tax=Glycomyces terrestris TaxID=2493553 RepID=A0A426UWE3_9ACTN|nr:SHOCT domain-containing protein [Glycomyces terrestris]RRR98640.1 SHOCT domain-containing protein [Glycomyces terrestris]